MCDATCGTAGRGYLCGAGDSVRFGGMCRVCFTDEDVAREAQRKTSGGKHVVMCDTMRPPPAAECTHACGLKKDTVEYLETRLLSLWGGGFPLWVFT